jgi:hypothetical protein
VIEPVVWCDPHPKVNKYLHYRNNLKKKFKIIHESQSLSYGYIKAIRSSNADYLFMLEHDWIFKQEFIFHNIHQIVFAMQEAGIYHLRFNKRANIIKRGFDSSLTERRHGDFVYCKTPFLSNNPHIIERKKYLEFIAAGLIKIDTGSLGIEQVISKNPQTWGAIYGPKNYPQTVEHLDGKRGKNV